MNTAIEDSATAAPLSAPKASAPELSKKQHDQEVASFMPLVHKIASKVYRHTNGQAALEDLVSWGTMGLLEAMSRFEPSHGARLSTFAYYRIRGAMLDNIGKVAPLSRKCYRQARAAGDHHAIYRNDIETDHIVDQRSGLSPQDFAEQNQMESLLRDAMETLSPEERHLVQSHYFAGETLAHAGKTLGISKSWACRSHANALRNLRRSMNRASACAA